MPFRMHFTYANRLNLMGVLAVALLSGCPLLTLAAVPNAAGSITLQGRTGDPQDPENTGTGTCTLNAPEAGRTLNLSLANPASDCYGIRVETVAMSNLPAATEVLFTDDYHCDTTLGSSYYARRDPPENKNFWIKIKTTAPGATLQEESLAVLTGKNKFITNVGSAGIRSKGLMIVDSKQSGDGSRITWNLSCVQIKVSATTSTVRGQALTLPSAGWDNGREENESANFMCPPGTVMTGRKHGDEDKADENGMTWYKCAALTEGITRVDDRWSISFPECGFRLKEDDDDDFTTCTDAVNYKPENQRHIYFSCPADEVMVGRSHKGDENEPTTYLCAGLYRGSETHANRIIVEPGAWSAEIQESGADKKGSEYTCPTDQVVVGRSHEGDENGNTRYQCASLRAPR